MEYDKVTIEDLKALAAKRGIKIISSEELDAVGAFIDVYQAMYGFKARHMWLNTEDLPTPFWEPWNTGWYQYKTMAEAWMAEGFAMARDLELPVMI